tara:strand:+ start:4631 stop:5281 length:651 start_codon:yes stop_codon:yes gene_type:complete
MTFESYLEQVGAVSDVKRQILNELWGVSSAFPRKWVASAYLLQITGQKYFDRRIRELRDGQGCDIETQHIDGEHKYRLVSAEIGSRNQRYYLTEKQKQALFEAAEYMCAVCGKRADVGVRGLQADHKVPLMRGGSHDLSNWQTICNECNVAKRRACQDCQMECRDCSWSYPETTGLPVIVRVSSEDFDFIREILNDDPRWLEKAFSRVIEAQRGKA